MTSFLWPVNLSIADIRSSIESVNSRAINHLSGDMGVDKKRPIVEELNSSTIECSHKNEVTLGL